MADRVRWGDFEASEPAFSSRIRARFSAHPHHVVATVAADGRPRAWGSNIFMNDGELWLGAMTGSLRVVDLRREPRIAVHSAPLSEQLDGGDARIEGTATVLDPVASTGWMATHAAAPAGGERPTGDVVLVGLERVVLTEVQGDVLALTVWEPGRGIRIVHRP